MKDLHTNWAKFNRLLWSNEKSVKVTIHSFTSYRYRREMFFVVLEIDDMFVYSPTCKQEKAEQYRRYC